VRTTQYLVSLVGLVSATGPKGEALGSEAELIERHLDQVMDELLVLGATDPSIDLAENEVTMTVLVAALNPLEATVTASGTIRSAIHAAKGSTPDWPGPDDKAWSVQLLSLSTAPVPVKSDQLISA